MEEIHGAKPVACKISPLGLRRMILKNVSLKGCGFQWTGEKRIYRITGKKGASAQRAQGDKYRKNRKRNQKHTSFSLAHNIFWSWLAEVRGRWIETMTL